MTQSAADRLGNNLTPPKGAPVEVTTTPKLVRIKLEENDNIPPNGLYLGLNGVGYMLQPGVEVDVPYGLVEILDNAVESKPQIDPTTRRVMGFRDRLRYPYTRIVREAA